MASSTLATLFFRAIILLVAAHSTLAVGREGQHFVLIHGLGHGAWCWYRVTTLLEDAGNSVTAIDLTSNGQSKVVADTVTSVAQYTKPLTDFLANSVTAEKVILVGHSLGGSSVSYAMELFPDKISKAVFLSAYMPYNGQQFLGGPLLEYLAIYVEKRTFILNYANGPSAPPTSAMPNLTQAKAVFYNKSPAEDVSLAYASLSPQPAAPNSEILSLTSTKYGSVRRFYIRTSADHCIPPKAQETIIEQNPPEEVFQIDTDHSSFFSEPVALVKLLLHISAKHEGFCGATSESEDTCLRKEEL